MSGQGRWFFYMFYGSLVAVAAVYGYTATSFLVDSTAATPKFAAALIEAQSPRAPASAPRQHSAAAAEQIKR